MRQVGSLETEQQAKRLADYLLAQGIESRVDRSEDGWLLWALDDDHVAQAKEELATFRESPDDAKYDAAQDQAKKIRKEQQAAEQRARKNMVRVQPSRSPLQADTRPVTIGLLVISVLVAALTHLGDNPDPLGHLLIINSTVRADGTPAMLMTDIKAGQVWRLVTPIFLHFGPLHLAFNCIMVYQFGTMVEWRYGSRRFLWLVLVTAIISNLGQYAWSMNPRFGGLSGVLYALFGFVWMKCVYDSASGFMLRERTVYILLGLLLLGMTGVLEHVGIRVANAAHLVGLLSGMAIGFAPAGWKMLRSR